MADFAQEEAEESGSNVGSSDHEEEPEETEADRAFVVEGPVADDQSSESSGVSDDDGETASGPLKKRRRMENLDEEDIELLEENLGVKLKRKKKFSRVKVLASDEEEEDESRGQSGPGRDRDAIASHLFDDETSEQIEGEESGALNRTSSSGDAYGALPSSSEDEDDLMLVDVDDFIVDEEGRPVRQRKKKSHRMYSSAQLQEAQDIFGVDLAQFADELDDEEEEGEDEEEDEDEDEDLSDDEEGRPRPTRKKRRKQRHGAANVYDLFEPIELERRHFTDRDDEIRAKDIPERFQLRSHPVIPEDEEGNELRFESEWIYRHAFSEPPISDQHKPGEVSSVYGTAFKPPSTIPKIREALAFMRNQSFEVPFIANYRKEYVEPELSVEDLWTIWQWDERWCKFQARKRNMARLFVAVQEYQRQKVRDNPDHLLPEGQRMVSDRDIYRVDGVQSLEELKDVYDHFSLYYGNELTEMRKAQKAQESVGDPAQTSRPRSVKVSQKDFYTVCCQTGLLGMAEKFGLTPEQFGENLRDNYQRHETEQYPNEPEDVAQDYVCQKFPTVETVLKGAVYMVGIQLSREPVVRQTIRQTYSERSKVSVKPTKKGKKEIDEWHECSAFKYLKNKPVKTLRGDQFLRMTQAEQDGLLKISISIDMDTQSSLVYGTYLDEIKQLYYRDEFSLLVEKWNDLRVEAVEMALGKFLYPVMEKELRRKLLQEAQDHVIQQCALKLQRCVDVAPYQPEQQLDDDEFDGTGTKTSGIRVLSCTFEEDRDVPVWCAMLNGNGQLMDSLRLPNIRIRPNSFRRDAKKLRDEDMTQLKEFVLKMRPHVVAIAAANRDALYLMDDIRQCLMHLEQEHQMASIAIELVDDEVARIYQSSRRAKEEFPEHGLLLKQAVSLGRCLQDPLLEFSGLCSNDNELLCLKLHPLQGLVSQEQLLTELQIQLINEVNNVGVDVNKALELTHHERVVQFVCGLGPRKAAALLRTDQPKDGQLSMRNRQTLRQKRSVLENRSQLVTTCEMGPQVFVNCAAFIKIDSSVFSDSASDYTEVLDGSRIHPETYEWARKMAIDALEYDESAEDALQESIEEILESPDKLKDLDLDAFAEELARQNLGRKQTTLYDIRDELFGLYKERRKPYRSLTIEERFRLLTGETAETLEVGRLIMCRVSGIVRKKPTGELLDNANAIMRSDQTNLYQCPFCMVGVFQDLSAVWSHLDDGSCPGQAIGVRTQLDNGITGFISLKNLSDRSVRNPEERVKEGMSVHCRILRLNMEKFQVDLTSRSQDLADKDGKFGSARDTFYDEEAALRDADQEKKLKEKPKRTYVKRVIAHPAFHNVSFEQAIQLLADMDLGECIIRPSSKGDDRLTITWKVDESLYQHIDVTELGKENAFSLGRTLRIGNEEYEDLDEIIARHIQPMASFARDLFSHRYYRNADGGSRATLDKLLSVEKKRTPSRIPYFFSVSRELPGRFLISYMPRTKSRHEFVSVTPEGYRFRSQVHPSLNALIQWFKEHFRDPPPAIQGSIRSSTTGGNTSSVYSAGYQSVGQPFSNTPLGGGWVDRPSFPHYLRH